MAKMGYEPVRIEKKMGNRVLWRTIAGRDIRFRSKAEYNWALYCQWRKEQDPEGNIYIQNWEYEIKRIHFDDDARKPRSYLPDFWITEAGGNVHIEEVKGWLDGPTRSRCRKFFLERPEKIHLILLRFDKGNAHGRRLVDKYCERIISMQECLRNLRGILPFE